MVKIIGGKERRLTQKKKGVDMALYKFYWDCGRNGEVIGIFSATQDEVDNLIGKDVYFGGILGKYSEIYGPIEEGEIIKLTDDKDFISKAEEYGLIPVGYNPLYYVEEDEDE